ncbi:hypothetical protein N0V90_012309 [Kalmusia sp. IMI 367209]|nr:hypothetical protein N0V90_012309 [Kalmusia sp. IMI 367209]
MNTFFTDEGYKRVLFMNWDYKNVPDYLLIPWEHPGKRSEKTLNADLDEMLALQARCPGFSVEFVNSELFNVWGDYCRHCGHPIHCDCSCSRGDLKHHTERALYDNNKLLAHKNPIWLENVRDFVVPGNMTVKRHILPRRNSNDFRSLLTIQFVVGYARKCVRKSDMLSSAFAGNTSDDEDIGRLEFSESEVQSSSSYTGWTASFKDRF